MCFIPLIPKQFASDYTFNYERMMPYSLSVYSNVGRFVTVISFVLSAVSITDIIDLRHVYLCRRQSVWKRVWNGTVVK